MNEEDPEEEEVFFKANAVNREVDSERDRAREERERHDLFSACMYIGCNLVRTQVDQGVIKGSCKYACV